MEGERARMALLNMNQLCRRSGQSIATYQGMLESFPPHTEKVPLLLRDWMFRVISQCSRKALHLPLGSSLADQMQVV